MSERRRTVRDILKMHADGEPIVMVSTYDALFARLADKGGVDMILVGDSVNQVMAGEPSTLSATVEQMIYHSKMVMKGAIRALVVGDMPFMSYQVSPEDALRNAGRMMKETGVQAVKVEGGVAVASAIRAMVHAGIPTMGHLGLTPQSVHALGGYRVQGRGSEARERLIDEAKALQDAGAFALVLELVPTDVAGAVTAALEIPTIGIGAGPDCSGQVLVLHDLVGLNDTFKPRFVKRYATLAKDAEEAVRQFGNEVRSGAFPDDEHSFAE